MTNASVLTLNGGSSSVKFAVFSRASERLFSGQVERVGKGDTSDELIDSIIQQITSRHLDLIGIGHRIVHGGTRLLEHQVITQDVIDELRRAEPFDLAHLPREIALIESVKRRFPSLPQIACFDTVFHRDLPRVSQLLPIPRRFDRQGVRRFGFHGLSYTYLIDALRREAGDAAVDDGRVILAHLGSGASMAAVRNGKPVDTTMAFTPTAGLVMGTRPGDIDPGLLTYLMRAESMTPERLDEFINRECGLTGVSELGSDMRDLIARRDAGDERAAEAVELFCHSARKWIGALAAVMGGLDMLVFSGGIGEHSSPVRAGVCQGLGFLGLDLDAERNAHNCALISGDDSRVVVRVIATDEEIIIAQIVARLLAGA